MTQSYAPASVRVLVEIRNIEIRDSYEVDELDEAVYG